MPKYSISGMVDMGNGEIYKLLEEVDAVDIGAAAEAGYTIGISKIYPPASPTRPIVKALLSARQMEAK